ncbi:MAG: radical SAM protein [Myxococcales bacterium]|nr:radical SAM protein [Myxococcales bacterium]
MPRRPDDPSAVGLRDLPGLVKLHRAARDRRSLMAQPDLTYLFWEATLRCNLRCLHCGSACEATSPVRELTTGEVVDILRTIAADFDSRRIFVSVTGGEPLLRRDVEEVVAEMTRLGMRACVVTNGTLLDAARARSLHAAGMRTASVSVDGTRAAHEEVRGRGTYDPALAGLRAARAAGFEDVEAITCVRPGNLDALPALEAEVRRAGANLWRLITIDTMGRLAGAGDTPLWLGPAEARRLLDFVAARRRELARTGEPFRVQFSCGGFLGPRRDLAVRPAEGQCYAGLCVGSILCDGQVSACPSLPRSWAQGSALEHRFSRLWHTRFEAHRATGWRRTGACDGCGWFSTCMGGGLHERLAQPDSFCWVSRQSE